MDKVNNSAFQGTAKLAPMVTKEAAQYMGFEVSTLRKWRAQGKPPLFTVHNKRVYYQKQDLDEFLASTFCPKRDNKL